MIFDERYDRLNAAQKKAVDCIDGPVMVVAGPGTGKTEVVALRVANILKKVPGMNPGNILCLTYSTAGAKTMRDRLRGIIGPAAYGVGVDTVHGWCNDLILRNPTVFEEFRALEQVSPIERLRIVRGLLGELPAGSVLGRPVPERDRASDILGRISEMKREGVEPEDLQKHVEPYRGGIQSTKTGKKRDTETQSYKDDLRRVRQFEEFIALYRGYCDALRRTHRYDTDDMVLVALRALRQHEWLLVRLQEQYQYVIADEFQDLNGAQYQVLDLLTRYVIAPHEPNLCIVGDDDQAIYRFQGASMENMIGFLARFPKAVTVTLTESFRCSQKILDAASAVIRCNEDRISQRYPDRVSKDLRSKNKGVTPAFLRLPSTETEYGAVAAHANMLHVQERIPWSSIAVLCRRNGEVTQMAEAMNAAGIPCIVTAKLDLLKESAVLEAIALLQAVAHPGDDAKLSAALASPCTGIHPVELARIWVPLSNRNRRRANGEAHRSVREEMLERFDELPSRLKEVIALLEKLSLQQDSYTLPGLLEELLKGSGLLPPTEASAEDPLRIASIHALYDYVKNRCYEQKSLTLAGLLQDIDQILAEPRLRLAFDAPHLTADGVQIMTAHGAKGLEFDAVILPHLRYGNWGNRRERSDLALPDHLIFGVDPEVEKRAAQEDERRLLYVAMTRARQSLLLTMCEQYRSGEDLRDAQVSAFIAEAGERVAERMPKGDDLPRPVDILCRTALPMDEAFRAYLTERLQEFRLSTTSLSAFIEDPQKFLWEHLLQQPRAKAPHLSYGTCIHRALEAMSLAWKEGAPFSPQELIAVFEETLARRELFTAKDREHYLSMGREVLLRYATETCAHPPIVLEAERSFHAYLPDPADPDGKGVPLTGKVDRIDLYVPDGRECRIIDFKTGAVRKTEVAVKKSGQYDQLVFYRLLTQITPGFLHTPKEFVFDYVGNDREGRSVVPCAIPESDVERLKKLTLLVWRKISAFDFTPVEAIVWGDASD